MGVEAHEALDLISLGSQQLKGFLDGFHQLDEFFEVAIVSSPRLNFLPKEFNRIIVR